MGVLGSVHISGHEGYHLKIKVEGFPPIFLPYLGLHESNLGRSKFPPTASFVGGYTGLYYRMKIVKTVKTRR